jgi:Protein of unknown function (DUF3617)
MMFSRQGVYRAVLFAGVLGAVVYCQTTFAAMNLHEGKWEMTTVFPGGQPQKTAECLTKDKLTSKDKNKPGCTVDQKVTGSTLTMHQICTRNGSKEEVRLEATYAGDSMKGTLRINSTDPTTGKPMLLTGTITGKRIGACEAAGK